MSSDTPITTAWLREHAPEGTEVTNGIARIRLKRDYIGEWTLMLEGLHHGYRKALLYVRTGHEPHGAPCLALGVKLYTIDQLKQLYRTLTGRDWPTG